MKIKQLLTEGYLAFVVPSKAREELARLFPPKHPEFIGHHITYKFGVPNDTKFPPTTALVTVVGYAEEDGLEALVVTIDGEEKRPDGKQYHITWSLDRAKGKKPVMSNDLIAHGKVTSVKPYSFRTQMELF